MIRNFLITRQRLIVFSFSMPGQHSNYFFLNRWEKRRRAPDSRMERRLLKVCTSLTLFLGKKSRRCERSPKMPYLVQSQIGIEIELSMIRMRMAEVVSASWAQASLVPGKVRHPPYFAVQFLLLLNWHGKWGLRSRKGDAASSFTPLPAGMPTSPAGNGTKPALRARARITSPV